MTHHIHPAAELLEERPIRPLRRWCLALPALAPVLAYLALASHALSLPGIYYDEVLQAVPAIAALKGTVNGPMVLLKGSVITLHGHSFPLLILPYLGATQAAVLTAAFAIAGVSVLTMRATFIGLGILPLVFTYYFTRRLFDTKTALIGSLLLATDPTYIFSIRSDNGPTAIMMICKMGALWCLLAWWQDCRAGYLYGAAFLCGFGLYDKVNFVWFLGALVVAAVCLYGRDLVTRIRHSPLSLWLIAMFWFSVGASVLLAYTALTRGGVFRSVPAVASGQTAFGVDNSDLLGNFVHRAETFVGLLQGYTILDFYTSSFAGYHYPYSRGLFPMTALSALIVVALALLLVQTALRSRWVQHPRKALLLLMLTALIVGASTITPTNLMYHHLLVAYPFLHLFAAQFLVSIPAILLPRRSQQQPHRPAAWRGKRWGWRVSVLVVSVALVSNLGVVANYYRVLGQTGGIGMWSDAIYSLSDYLAGDQRTIVCLDWGINLNLLALSDGELHTQELWQQFLYSGDYSPEMADLIAQPNHVFVFHAPKYTGIYTIAPEDYPRITFLKTVVATGRTAVLEKRFFQRNGDELFELYTVVSNSPTSLLEASSR
jgi:4-amino-4-deoxy-L-arabinose transferase-like glycosyltransferase